MRKLLRQYTTTFFLVAALAGCAGQAAFREGQALIEAGRIEEGLGRLRTATQEEPTNPRFRMTYLEARDRAVTDWIERGDESRRTGKNAEAETFYRRTLRLDPNNTRAKERLAEMARDARHQGLMAEAEVAWARGDSDKAIAHLRTIVTENPQHAEAMKLLLAIQEKMTPPPVEPKLSSALRKPITIEFRDVPLKQVFEIISRTSGLNFIFDKDVRTDQKTTIFIRDSTVQDAINLLLVTQQLEQRVLDKNSIVIYPNTSTKAKDYQLMSVRSFFLTNADAKAVANTIKTILKTKDLVVDERQNMLTMRDTPEAIRLAEKLLYLHDLPEPEVMLEVEVLEIQRARLLQLGIQWPDQLTLAPLAGADGNLTLADLKHLSTDQVGATVTPLTINAKKQDGDANLLANPRIRARNRESAKILIGNRLPNITTTSTATGFVSESVQYVDVGLKLEVQPTIYLDREIAIKLSLEVSSIVNQVQTKSGTLAYQIGTRTASTVLRLKDGENQVLAGLINDEDRSTANKIPGFGDIPVLGRLFGSQRDDNQKTEIVLSITPRLIRSTQRPTLAESEFEAGTDNSLKSRMPEYVAPLLRSPAASSLLKPGERAGATGSDGRGETNKDESDSSSSASPGPTSFYWQGPKQVQVGEAFTVALAIQPGEPITSIPYSIGYEPKVLEPISVSAGDFLKQGGAATNFSYRINRDAGNIVVTETRTGADGAASPGTLATIMFRSVGTSTGTNIPLLAVSPIGLHGNSVSASIPPPQSVSIRP